MSIKGDTADSIGSVIHHAINNYKKIFPEHSAVYAIAQKCRIHPKKLQRAINNEIGGDLTVSELGSILKECEYSIGWLEIRDFYHSNQTKG